MSDSQWPDGAYPVYSPMPVAANGKAAIRATDTYSPGWAEAGIVCPYNIYKMYKSISDSYVNVGKSLYTLFY